MSHAPEAESFVPVTAQEQLSRRKERAARFGTDDRLSDYRPPTDPEAEARKRERAERFGTAYEAPDESGLIDVGAAPASPSVAAWREDGVMRTWLRASVHAPP